MGMNAADIFRQTLSGPGGPTFDTPIANPFASPAVRQGGRGDALTGGMIRDPSPLPATQQGTRGPGFDPNVTISTDPQINRFVQGGSTGTPNMWDPRPSNPQTNGTGSGMNPPPNTNTGGKGTAPPTLFGAIPGTNLQNTSPAPQGFVPQNGLSTGYGMGLVPGMAQPTLAPQAGIVLQRLLATAQSPFTMNGIASGTSTLANEINNIQSNMAMWAAMNPDLAKGVDWQGPMNDAIQQYVQFVNGQPASAYRQDAPANSLGTGAPLGYAYTRTTGDYNPATDPTVQGSPASWFATPQATFPGMPGTGVQGANNTPAVPFNFGMTGDPALTGSHTLAQNGFAPPSNGTSGTGNPQLDALLKQVLAGGALPSTITTNPLGYTQYNSPASGTSGVDQAQLLSILASLLSNKGGQASNYWQL